MPVIVYAGILYYLSSLSHLPVPSFKGADKICHIMAYSVFAFLLSGALSPYVRHRSVMARMLIVIAGTLLYGFSDEWHQRFVVARTSDFYDWLADGLGGLLGSLTFIILFHVQQNRRIRKIQKHSSTMASLQS